VRGAGGFIGSHLVEALVEEGARVRALVRYNLRGDAGSAADAVSGCEIIFHLAPRIAIPYSYVNPRDFFETNVVGSLNVAQAALTHGVERLVHTSTSEVYGSPETVPIGEDHPLQAQSPYAASKVGADKLMDSFHRSFDLPAVVLRPFNTYGPFQSARAIIPTIVSQALTGGPLRLGSLHPRRDLTFVSDTAAGFIAVAGTDATIGRTIQLGTGSDVSIGELVDVIGEVLGRELEVELDEERVRPPESEVERLVSRPHLANELAGWIPTVSLREGLERTIPWIEANLHRFRTGEYAR
jgi:nucleoside-diphosphate-sugar epimerase